ncbi:hypothetical protein BDV38DRAFT_2836 [Aspergillus pseudotamarii]|uniref:BHLH domain-containing protein n=1 Tax=Aspergillus pseudotamarii TaxID=132259 RepID=A0A5N6TBT7_ASPPS|nr:uncharacterized protein BDV38DRAFT_2836 [Aspergillus pseudotamarii]KAE8143766.1 hypothetical protein BDV38DRAFT_2836 [Aspergillus pseudotamarii]
MAYTRTDPSFTLSDDERMYMSHHSPMHRPYDTFPAPKGPDPLSANWNYDSAIDLFSLNTMMPENFALDVPNEPMGVDPKDFPADFFAPPPDISGFTISNHSGEDAGSITSDLESDDQSWSPTYAAPAEMLPAPGRQSTRRKTTPVVKRETTWSSSPELAPQEYPTRTSPQATPTSPPVNRKMTRTTSVDSNASNASTGQTTTATTTSGRNAAKRAAHNIIEKRYRTNMNAKFVALEKAMCGGVQKSSKGGSASLKKSEILTNAIAYMQELQEENKALQKELAMFKQNMVPSGMWRHTKGAETFRA